jgi:cell division protease FtsH
MPIEAWLPVGFSLPDGAKTRLPVQSGDAWQIVETAGYGRALLVKPELVTRWVETRLIDWGSWQTFKFGADSFYALSSGSGFCLAPVNDSRSPNNKSEALAFAVSLRETRVRDAATPLHDAIYIESISRLLPTYTLSTPQPDDVVLGSFLTGGAPVSVHATRRIRALTTWLGDSGLAEVIRQSGVSQAAAPETCGARTEGEEKTFALAGRPMLEQFFREHVVDIIENADRYRKLGIEFPSAILLHGPPGCGKTFAVERLVEYLGWPSFSIDSTSIGSPFIHETSRKVAEVFERAIKDAPSVLTIDEMEAYLADREMGAGSSHHRVEEVGEFLRRIPEAIANRVLVIAMTNRIEMIDPAILRRGRFDHAVEVGMPSREEVDALLHELLSKVPTENIDYDALSQSLAGRPLSDVAFVTREAARRAAAAGRSSIGQENLLAAVKATPSRGPEAPRKIGFV